MTQFRDLLQRLFALLALLVLSNASDAGMIVDSTSVIEYAGIVATPGQVFQITATGEIDMAYNNGHYVTNPDGTILVAPTPVPGGGVYEYMIGETGGSPAVAGSFVNIAPWHGNDLGQLFGSPFGGLIAGFSSTPTPTSLADFTDGFSFIGSSGSIVAPTAAAYLFLSINDTYRPDNMGSYNVEVTDVQPVPEPSSLVLAALGAVAVTGWRQRRMLL